MATFPQTSNAMYQLRAEHELGFGSHLGDRSTSGVPGVRVGEVPFDPSRHLVNAINPLSTMELVTGVPHVTQVVPYRPVEMSVILYEDPANEQLPFYLQPLADQKRRLAHSVINAISESRQNGDKTNLYVVGQAGEDGGANRGPIKVIKDTQEPVKAAHAIANICSRGLAFVISDFNNLPLDQFPASSFPRTVAVKANHKFEMELPADVGFISLGGLNEVNTNSSRQRNRVNEALKSHHAGIEASLGSLGLVVAQVVFDNASKDGLDTRVADKSIASAVRQISRR